MSDTRLRYRSMPTLHLLRHAKSDWGDPNLTDHDRPLNARGRRAAALMAAHLRDRGTVVDLALCSTAVRTRQTLEIVLDAFDAAPATEYDVNLYGASHATLVASVRAAPEHVRSVMLVGHNPGIGDLACLLAGDGDPAELADMAAKYPTCALATLVWEGRWSDVTAGGATLSSWVPARVLGEA